MKFRRTPNPNRNHPQFCPYCSGTQLFPNEEDDFAWSCQECLRVSSVRFFGQDELDSAPLPAHSTNEALQESLRKREHSTAVEPGQSAAGEDEARKSDEPGTPGTA